MKSLSTTWVRSLMTMRTVTEAVEYLKNQDETQNSERKRKEMSIAT